VSHGNIFEWLRPTLAKADRKTTFVYMDPPYYEIGSFLYGKNGDTHRTFDHGEFNGLCVWLKRNGWKFAVSYNDCPKVRELYRAPFKIDTPAWTYGMGKEKKSKEVVIQ
jgi:site-specific DNA-adenine methylase